MLYLRQNLTHVPREGMGGTPPEFEAALSGYVLGVGVAVVASMLTRNTLLRAGIVLGVGVWLGKRTLQPPKERGNLLILT